MLFSKTKAGWKPALPTLDEEEPQRDPIAIHPSHPGIKGFRVLGFCIRAISSSRCRLLLIKCTVFEGVPSFSLRFFSFFSLSFLDYMPVS
jgi:hypothetical protein